MWSSCLFLALFVAVQGRGVNISNTWVLPEEGFPVFYRYFRDRISWYEADAVCQFHHANLVTVDTTAQYDAVRAYLKELDISSAVWVGLIRSNPDGDFTWTDYRGLSGEGYWSSAPDSRTAPLCAAADPAADYRWNARACGGPSVASFICELPVPQWALGSEGCMVRALPALTVLYLPESAAVQLTTDCGFAGVRRVQCTGNVKREDLLKDLSCVVDDQTSSTTNIQYTSPNWINNTDVSVFDQDNNNAITEENITTSQDEIDQASHVKSTPIHTYVLGEHGQFVANQYEPLIKNEKIQNINTVETNNLNNNIPSIIFKDDISNKEYVDKIEDERHIQHKLLHDELARLGNFETIFNQPTDHFIPPLVMAKAKLSNDMTALSFEEKLAQERDDYQTIKHFDDVPNSVHIENYSSTSETPTVYTPNNVLISVTHSTGNNENRETGNIKKAMPKKYTPKYTKYDSSKRKSIPIINVKKNSNTPIIPSTPSYTTISTNVASSIRDGHESAENMSQTHNYNERDESSIELTVIIREPSDLRKETVQQINKHNDTLPFSNTLLNSTKLQQNADASSPNIIVLHDEIINITFNIDNDNHSTGVLEISTKMPIFKDDVDKNVEQSTATVNNKHSNFTMDFESTETEINKNVSSDFIYIRDIALTSLINTSDDNSENNSQNVTDDTKLLSDTNLVMNNSQTFTTSAAINENITVPSLATDTLDSYIDVQHNNGNSSEEEIDDFQSSLLSGADEPLHKHIRARRPQPPQNHSKKFNPFRILG